MDFTHIFFLIGGAAIIGPILAHLLNRAKYRKIPFTMLHFLQLSQKQTESRRKMHDFLILLLRCLIILLIALLFAGPVLLKEIHNDSSKEMHVMLLDNSISMSCQSGSDTYFEQMIDKAAEYLNQKQSSKSVFYLYSTVNGLIGKDLTAESAKLLLNELLIQAGVTDLSTLSADLQQDLFQKDRQDSLDIHIISDFTDEFIQSLLETSPDDVIKQFSYDIIGKDQNVDNLAITNATVLNLKDNSLTLAATVSNWGNKTTKRLIRADLFNSSSDEFFVNPVPGQQTDVMLTLNVSEYIQQNKPLPIEIKLIPQDDLIADDTYPLAVSIQADHTQKVLLVGTNTDELFLMDTALKTLKESRQNCIHSTDLKTFSAFSPRNLYTFDMVILSTIDKSLNQHTDVLRQYLESGGHCVFFMTNPADTETAQLFYEQGILPVLPNQVIHEVSHLKPLETFQVSEMEGEIKLLETLQQYHIEKTPLWCYNTCQTKPETLCLWSISPDASLFYQNKCNNGYATFINTSINDTRSSLTKTPSILPLVRYLLGSSEDIISHSFACNETVHIPLREPERYKELDYIDASDSKHTVLLSDSVSVMRIPGPHQYGWIRVLTDPVQYIGVHPNAEETKMKRTLSPTQISETLKLLFQNPDNEPVTAQQSFSKEMRSLSRYIIMIILLLIVLDSYISNRIQRS